MRHNTAEGYERSVRLYLKPRLGKIFLENLTVREVQSAIDGWNSAGIGKRTIHKNRTALSAALTRAMREELIFRNVARLVEMPAYKPKPKTIWTVEQQLRFFEVAKNHRWCIGFLMGFLYGMREGEILGLRWCDIDFQNDVFVIRQQLQMIAGKMKAVSVKTDSSNRTLPLSPKFKTILIEKALYDEIDINDCFRANYECNLDGLIVSSKVDTPVHARNFLRAFYALSKKAGLPKTTFHASRHIASTTHKNVGTPLRDAQEILGHSNSNITYMIYQHGDMNMQRRTIEATENVLNLGVNLSKNSNCCQKLLSILKNPVQRRDFSVVAPPRLELGTQGSSGSFFGKMTGCGDPCFEEIFKIIPKPALKHLRTAMRTQVLGAIAVKTAVIFSHDNSSEVAKEEMNLQKYILLSHAIGEILSTNKFGPK